jgi:hypothetical protein
LLSKCNLHRYTNARRSPSFVFLGGSVDVGLFKNCFGDANSFYRRSAFLALGGYSEAGLLIQVECSSCDP